MYEAAGTYQDMLALIARADLPSRESSIPQKGVFDRAFVEPCFQALGFSVSAVLSALPADAALAIEQKIYRAIVGGNPVYPFADGGGALARARTLCETVRRETGASPAIAALLAHAPVDDDLLYLNVELFRHALRGIRTVRANPCRPKLVNAMDAFALDMLAPHEEGAYAAFMSSYHLGFDRMPALRRGIGAFLLGRSCWPSVAGRIRKTLHGGGEMMMVLGGGVDTTARLYYALRESVGSLCRRASRKDAPAAVVRRAGDDLLRWFARLTREGAIGPELAKNRWRMLEMSVICGAVADGGFAECAAGRLPAPAAAAFAALGAALGCAEREVQAEIKSLAAEFARPTPYRKRFFRFLTNAVVRKGRPVVLLPLTLGDPGALEVRWGNPLALQAASGSVRDPRVLIRATEGLREMPVDDFAEEFVAAAF